MPGYERLQEDQRDKRFTIADTIDVLVQKNIALEHPGAARVQVGGLQLPSEEIVGLVNVFVESAADDKTFIISLPTSTQFRAKRQDTSEIETFEIFQLDGATFDCSGDVELPDGTHLCMVEVIPALLPYHVTDLDWCIVHHTIEFIGAEQECYTYPIHFERPRDALDCSTLPTLKDRIPLLKQIQGYIADQEPTLRDLSEQQIAKRDANTGAQNVVAT